MSDASDANLPAEEGGGNASLSRPFSALPGSFGAAPPRHPPRLLSDIPQCSAPTGQEATAA